VLNAVFNCPRCGRPVGDIPPRGRLVAICGKCRIKYEVLHGHVADGTVQEVVVRQPTHNFPAAVVAQRYDLRVEYPTGKREEITFQLPDNEPRISIRPGDLLYLIYLMQGEERTHLLTVDNATTGKVTILASPTDVATKKAWFIGGGAGLLALLFLTGAGAPGAIALGVGGALCVGLGVALPHLLMPSPDISPDELRDLDASQKLLWEKVRLQASRTQAVRTAAEKIEIRDRLAALRVKMLGVGAQLYEKRIATLDRAIALTDSQVEVAGKLAAGYERSIQMIEIELEAGAAAVALDDDAANHITASLAEMRELEEQQSELMRQISANDDVDALLRTQQP